MQQMLLRGAAKVFWKIFVYKTFFGEVSASLKTGNY